MIYWREFDFDSLPDADIVQGSRQTYYINGDFAVDIEVTSFYDNGIKRAYPYIMMIDLCGNILYCRYLSDLAEIFQRVKERYKLTARKRIIMFVHNLSYEFQFFRDICRFVEVFARSRLKPLKAFDCFSCIEFRCSYSVSGLSLANLAKNLQTADIKKLNGDDFDYAKLRHSETPLTPLEMEYCEHDVLILHYWILEEIAKNSGKITKIPLTQTGYIRRDCREYIFSKCNRGIYRGMIQKYTPDADMFIDLHKAFSGGDTHGNYLHVRQILHGVTSFDFASCYPAVMVKCKFPRCFRKIKVLNREMFDNLISKKACFFKCSFERVKAKRHHHTLSLSKCDTIVQRTKKLDNGRVVEGELITTYFTDIDFKDFCEYYEYYNMRIIDFYYSDYQYLPTPFVEYILELFKNKTELKGLKDDLSQALYLKSKQSINGLYGMCVTNIVNDLIEFLPDTLEGWKTDDTPDFSQLSRDEIAEYFKQKQQTDYDNIVTSLDQYRNNNNSFLLYQWGVWVTSWARHFLRSTIAAVDDDSAEIDDFCYCDTDSIKILHAERHKHIIDNYNKQNDADMQAAMKYHELPLDAYKAKTRKGAIKTLGAWECDGVYSAFKTLGAKRYMYFERKHDLPKIVKRCSCDDTTKRTLKRPKYGKRWYDGGYNLVVAGLNKKKALPYILDNGGFKFFAKGMYIPRGHTGKATHTYIDDSYTREMVDYLGNKSTCHQMHYIHLEEQDYDLGGSKIFADFEEFLNGYTISGMAYEHKNRLLRTGAYNNIMMG